MTEKQIEFRIKHLSEKRKLAEALLVLLLGGIVVGLTSEKPFNILLSAIGFFLAFVIALIIRGFNIRIDSLINEIS